MTLTTKVKATLLAVAVVAGLVLPYTAGAYMVSIVTLAMVLSLFALSINLLAGFGGLVSLGHAGLMGAAAGSAAGPWLAGWLYDASGSYTLAFLIAAACAVLAGAAGWRARTLRLR